MGFLLAQIALFLVLFIGEALGRISLLQVPLLVPPTEESQESVTSWAGTIARGAGQAGASLSIRLCVGHFCRL